jgi:type IV pilus assembly protein PilF
MVACQSTTNTTASSPRPLKKSEQAARYNAELGIAYLNQGDRQRAKRKLLTALELAPKLPAVQASMAYYLEKTGDSAHAKQFYQRALALDPHSSAQKNNYATFLCQHGGYTQAMTLFVQAGNDVRYPNSAVAYENAGLCALSMHRDAESMTYFQQAIRQDPARKAALYQLVKLQLKHHEAAQAQQVLHAHRVQVMGEPQLLRLAVKVAHATHDASLAAHYEQRLKTLKTGEHHEHS